MSAKLLLRISALLSLLTFAGHIAGTFLPVPADQPAVTAAVAAMDASSVPMPVGKPRSFGELFLGTNLVVSLMLLQSAVLLWLYSDNKLEKKVVRRSVLIQALGLAVIAVISVLYFFPIPAAFTGIAAVLALLALQY